MTKRRKAANADTIHEGRQEPEAPAPAKRVTLNGSQKALFAALEERPVVVGIGPPGTGKTFACMVWARDAMRRGEIENIVFVRSPLELGKSRLGYLPGTAEEKMSPFCAPMYAIAAKLGIKKEAITCWPLGHIQGMTFENSVIIVDEIQNFDMDEYRAMVSRMGVGSVLCLIGDPEQDTRNVGQITKFVAAMRTVDCVSVVQFSGADNMRHPAIVKMLAALKGI